MKERTLKLYFFGGMFLVACLGASLVIFLTYHGVIAPSQDRAFLMASSAFRASKLESAIMMERAKPYASALILLVVIGTGSGFAFIRALSHGSVHYADLGDGVRLPLHKKTLKDGTMQAVLIQTANAEQIKAVARSAEQGADTALKYYERVGKNLNTIVTQRTKRIESITPAALPASAQQAHSVPTFHDLIVSGALAPGKPMILGYEHGQPRHGSFLDIYSAAVAGESGSGKTATLLFLIGSGLIAQNIRFVGIDPHYPHPKSLGFKLKPLWEAGLMEMATYKDDMLKALKSVERTIDRRMKQIDTDTTPVVLVIDELAFLSKTSIGKSVADTMERVSMEGRKCAVYMLAASQTWLTAKTGGSSSVRDTLTSAYVHRIKAKQANLLLQDKEETEKVKKQVKQAGEALLMPVNEESVVVQIPFCQDEDIVRVAEIVSAHLMLESVIPERQLVNDAMRKTELSQNALAGHIGHTTSDLSRFVTNNGALSKDKKADIHTKLTALQ